MAEISDDVFFASITELNAKLRARALSAEELTRAFSSRLAKLGPRYNALVLSMEETALGRARAVDGEIKLGRLRGLLQGIPFGAKDLLSVAYKPTTWGAKPYEHQRFEHDATVLRKLDRAAALLIGKLAMVELAGAGGYGSASASLSGPCLNPWDSARWAGGSSSGSAAAVAAGLVAFAIGSETWGSILTPCAYCGITGLRPTYGLVSRFGAMAVSWTLDKIGPMCRTAEDCGHVLQVMSGGDFSDPTSAGKSFYYTPQFTRKVSDLRVGFAPSDIAEHAEPSARPAFEAALQTLRDIGVQMVETELPDLPYGPSIRTIIAAEGSAAFEPLIESGGVDQLADARQIAGLRAGLEIPARDYLRAMRVRSLVREEFRKLFVKVDVVVSPSRFGVATKISEPLDQPRPGGAQPKARGLAGLGAAGNLAGLPALSLPCGFADGLPVALQLAGRAFTENNLLAIGVEYQRRTDWHRRRPKV
jgi:aspartyl-tRNA(Asn)/glutamyl-tRNA(Gln) amidotransferase subunit A